MVDSLWRRAVSDPIDAAAPISSTRLLRRRAANIGEYDTRFCGSAGRRGDRAVDPQRRAILLQRRRRQYGGTALDLRLDPSDQVLDLGLPRAQWAAGHVEVKRPAVRKSHSMVGSV